MECLAAGAQVYLRKPVDDRVLLSAIESAIRTHTVR
jgi:FixJ family two-component response regulator